MSTKTWTSTADFESATVATVLDDAIQNWHQGNKNGGLTAARIPVSSGSTVNGWTMTLLSGATSAVNVSGGVAVFTVKRENSDTKIFKYERSATTAYELSSTGTIIDCSFKTDRGQADRFGLFSSAFNYYYKNSVCFNVTSAGNFTFQVWDNDENQHNDAIASVAADTWYWFHATTDASTITGELYSSEALRLAGGAGDVGTVSIALSGVTTTVTCDRMGVRNLAAAGGTATSTLTLSFLESDFGTFYADAQANTVAIEWSSPTTVDYSSLAYAISGSASVLFDLLKKETASGTYTTYDNSGTHYELSAVTALSAENLYGFKVTVYVDTSATYAEVQDVSVDYATDTIAPSTLDYLKVHRPTSTDWWVVGFKDAVDAVNFSHNELRISEDAGSTWKEFEWDSTNNQFVMTATASTALKLLNPNTTETADYYGYAFVLDKSDLSITASDIKVQMRGVDKAANEGGWTTADNYGATSGSTYNTSNITECLRAIANRA